LRAVAYRQLNQIDQAYADLQRALTFAAPEDYVRVFIDEGEATRILLEGMRDESGGMKTYVQKLLAAFPPQAAVPALLHPSSLILHPLVEPLTDRELEVLRLMAGGLSNSEIAVKLIVAESTVKKHINHLFDKLDVETRVQAINKARELKLI
jgi:LuxR family maltose regulon positive regulatory protein